MNEHAIETVEITLEQAKKVVARGRALEKLTKNREFKALILEGYFESYASGLVLSKGMPNMQTPELQAEILKDIDGIGSFRAYLNSIRQQALMAEKEVAVHEQSLEEMRQEEVEGV